MAHRDTMPDVDAQADRAARVFEALGELAAEIEEAERDQ